MRQEEMESNHTPSVILIGDDVALGLSYKIDEAHVIASEGITASGMRNLLASSNVWQNFRNDPWMVICLEKD